MSKRCRLSTASKGKDKLLYDNVDDDTKHHDESTRDESALDKEELTMDKEENITLLDRVMCVVQQVENNLPSTFDYLRRVGKLEEMVRFYIIRGASSSIVHGLLSLKHDFPTSHTSSTLSTTVSSSLYSSSSSSLSLSPMTTLDSSLYRRPVVQWARLPMDVWKRLIIPMLSHTDLLESLQVVNRTLFSWVQSNSWVNMKSESVCVYACVRMVSMCVVEI